MKFTSEMRSFLCCLAVVLLLMTSSVVDGGVIKRLDPFRGTQARQLFDNNFSGNGKNDRPTSSGDEAAHPQGSEAGVSSWQEDELSGKGSLTNASPCPSNPRVKATVPARAICPYKFVEKPNKDREPAVLWEAEATTTDNACLNPETNKPSTEGACQLVYYDVEVKMKDSGETCFERIAVSRVCARDGSP